MARLLASVDSDTYLFPDEVLTSLDRRNEQSVHVKKFGAVGDGTTDDTAAIEAARAAVIAQGGGVLRFGSSFGRSVSPVYKVSKITVSSHILYAGEGATVKGSDSTVQGVFQSQGWADGTTISDATVEGFIIDGNNVASRGVFLNKAQSCRVRNNRILNLGQTSHDGIRLHWDTDSCWVEDNHITLGLNVPFGALVASVGVYCIANAPDPQGGGQNDTLTFGSVTNLSQGHVVRGNRIFNGTHGISLFGATDCRVLDNYIEAASHRAIILSPIALRNVVANNRLKDFGSTGIHLAWGSRWNVITGNNLSTTVSNNEGNGIKGYYGCSDNQVTGNTIDGPVAGAIRFAVGSVRQVVTGNRVNGSGGATIGVQVQSYLPSASGYYQPATPGDEFDITIEGNLFTNVAKGVELEASAGNAAGVRDIILSGNMADTPTTAGYSITESGSATVTGVRAVGNASVGSQPAWALARGERHFAHKDANSALIATPTNGFLRSGMYYQCTPAFSVTTSNTLSNGVFRCAPFRVPNLITLSKIGLEVTAVGDTGSTIRIGIYADNGFGYPGVLVADCGTVPGDSVAVSEVTVTTALSPGTYWVGAAVQGVTTSQPTVRTFGVTNGPGVDAIPLTTGATPAAAAAPSFGYAALGITGALPATFPTSLNLTSVAARVFAKIA